MLFNIILLVNLNACIIPQNGTIETDGSVCICPIIYIYIFSFSVQCKDLRILKSEMCFSINLIMINNYRFALRSLQLYYLLEIFKIAIAFWSPIFHTRNLTVIKHPCILILSPEKVLYDNEFTGKSLVFSQHLAIYTVNNFITLL